jgi:hypothetical protein
MNGRLRSKEHVGLLDVCARHARLEERFEVYEDGVFARGQFNSRGFDLDLACRQLRILRPARAAVDAP